MATSSSKNRDQLLERLVALSENAAKLSETEAKDRDAQRKRAQELNKKQEDAKRSLKNLPGIKQVLMLTGGEMTKSLKASFKLQERGLARGLTGQQMLNRNAETISHLNNNLQGYADSAITSAEMFESGLRNNNKELATLGALTKITGGNSKKLLGQLAKNTAGLGISQEGMSSLGTAVASMSQTAKMTTGELVDSLGGLRDELSAFGALGIGAEMQEAGVKLAGALGPAAAHLGPDLLGALTKGSTMVTASLLGVSKERERLINKQGNMTKNAFDLVITAGRASEKIIERYTKGARDQAFALEKANDIHGGQLLLANRAYKAMEAAATEQGMNIDEYAKKMAEEVEVNKKFTQTWDNFKSMIMGPLQQIFMGLGNKILSLVAFVQKNAWLKTSLQVIIGLMASLIALMKAKQAISAFSGGLKGLVGKGAGKAAAGAAGGAGKAGGGMLGGLGKGLGGLGKGLQALGNPKAMLGAVTIFLLATSLIPLAFAMNMMKGVGIEQVGVMIAAILGLALVAVLLAFVAPGIVVGAGAMALLGLALIPFAYGAALAADPLDRLLASLVKVADVPLLKVAGLGLALVALGYGLLIFSAMGVVSGALGAIGSFFSGGQSPLDKLVTIGKSADSILKLSDALQAIPSALDSIVASLKNITDKELDKLKSIASLGFMIGLGAADISVVSESISKSSSSPAQDEQVQLLKQAVERLESINEALDGANEQRSTANSQRNEQVTNSKTRPSVEKGGK